MPFGLVAVVPSLSGQTPLGTAEGLAEAVVVVSVY